MSMKGIAIMTYTDREFVYTRAFLAGWKRVEMDEENDLPRLEHLLLGNPKFGAVISGAGRA